MVLRLKDESELAQLQAYAKWPINGMERSMTERAFEQYHEERRLAGKCLACLYRPLVLPVDAGYVPRFVVIEPESTIFVEFQTGRSTDNATLVKQWRTAAGRWPWHEWALYKPAKGKGFVAIEWLGGE